jgi:rubredoxin
MPEMEPRCPDCGVTMEEMTLQSGGGYNLSFVSDENREGILGKLGMKQRFDSQTYVCPECGLARLYADVDED